VKQRLKDFLNKRLNLNIYFLEYFRNTLKSTKQKIKKKVINFAQFAPIISNFANAPRHYYISSEEYWKACKKNNLSSITYRHFLPSSSSERNPPKVISGEIHWKFNEQRFHDHPETFVISIPYGKTVGNMGTVITHDNKLLFDVSLQFGVGRDVHSIKSHHIFNYFRLPKCQEVPQTVALIATAGGNRYFHWLTDALPRIEILKKTLPGGIKNIDKFIINNGIPIIEESLHMLGIPLDKLIFVDSSTHIQAQSLVVPSLPGSTGNPPLWVCDFLRESFLKHKANIEPITKLYISRSKASYRKVKNEGDLLKCLSSFGFTTVWLEDHDFATQIALLANAKVIVAPHGAGLSNLMWCNSGTKIIEIFSPNYVNLCFWTIANQIGLDYFYLIDNGKNLPNDFSSYLDSDDIIVPIEELSRFLEMLLK
jgi:capsular polysaccharide biosynthesis protein